MRKESVFVGCVMSVWVAASATSLAATKGESLGDEMRQMIQSARDRVYPALVNIHLVTSNFYEGKEVKGQSVGSGTIISADGYVLTNYHVTDKGRRFRCTLADKREVSAERIGEDPLTDLAVLKLNMAELKNGPAIAVATLGDSSKIQVGDTVLAMGSPFALSRAVTEGIISNTERVFADGLGGDESEEMRLDRWQRTGLFTLWIQHDALIHPGNSGGPLVNLHGEVIGVNELGGSGIGFAIPTNLARQVADELIRDGRVDRSWIGVNLKSLKKTGIERGAIVNSVVSGSPADLAGIQPGDVIVAIDGAAVSVKFPEEIPPLMCRLASIKVGAKVAMEVQRRGEKKLLSLTTVRLEKDRGDEVALRVWGFTAMQITPVIAQELRLESAKGALVTGVRSGGNAATAKPALSGGEVIRAIDGQTIDDLKSLVDCYQKTMEKKPRPEYVLVAFDRRGENSVTLVKSTPDEDQPPPRELQKAWIGIAVQPVLKDLAERLGLGEKTGFRITRVYPNTIAASSGLKVGDVITHIDGSSVAPRRVEDTGMFYRQIKRLEIDSTVEVQVIRNGAKATIPIKLEESRLQPEEADRSRDPNFELAVRDVTFFDRVDRRWDESTAGVIVESVESASWSDLGGLGAGDLIQKIDDTVIRNVADFKAAMKTLAEKKSERVIFLVLRGVRTRFLYVEPEWSVKVNGATTQPASAPTTQATKK